MAKKRELTEAQRAMMISDILYGLEHQAHLPSELVQAMRDELMVHPEKFGLDIEDDEEALRVFHTFVAETGEKLYGKEWKDNFLQKHPGVTNEGVEVADEGVEMTDEGMEIAEEHKDTPAFLPSDNIQKCTIRISLQNVRPIVWRKLEVPSNITLAYLAEGLIYAMGWEGYHLHQFRKNGILYKEITDDDTFWFGGDRLKDEAEFTLGQVLTKKGDKMVFEYDFGDGWEHQVSLSDIVPYQEGVAPALHLLSGKNACPPEDCGGPWGYEALCEYYYTRKKNKNFPKEHYALVDKHFNPEYFPLKDYQADIEDMNSKA